MRLIVVSRGIHLSERMRDSLERRAHFTLGRFGLSIRGVQVSLSDENGPRGGVDKHCRVLVSPQRGEPILVEGHGDDLQSLVDRTFQRAGRAVARAIKRAIPRPSRTYSGQPRERVRSRQNTKEGPSGFRESPR